MTSLQNKFLEINSLAHTSGGRGVASSNLVIPTLLLKGQSCKRLSFLFSPKTLPGNGLNKTMSLFLYFEMYHLFYYTKYLQEKVNTVMFVSWNNRWNTIFH